MRIRKTFICLMILSQLLLCCASLCYAKEDILQESSPLYSELSNFSMKWADAVLKKDFSKLVSFSGEFQKEIVSKSFKDTSSWIYKFYYDNQACKQDGHMAYYDFLKSIKRLKFVFVKSPGEAMYIAYFYDADAIKINFPMKEDEIFKLIEDGYMHFFPINRKGDRWIIHFPQF